MECTQVILSESFNEIDTVPEKCSVATLTIGDEYHSIYNKENVIGRENTCDIIISNIAVSSKHAVIEAIDPDAHLIYDLGSTNKTKLGKMVLKPHVRYHINDGDSVTFGNVLAKYNISRQYPTTPMKVKENRNSCSIPETPERPDPTQELSAIEDNKFEIKMDRAIFDSSDTDLFDENETNPTGSQKENSNTKVENDIYELDTLSFDENVENNIQPISFPKQDHPTHNNSILAKNNVENTLMTNFSIYDVSTQEPVINQNHLSERPSVFDKDKEKNTYDGWEDFPEIASPVGLDTSNADNLDCPKAKLMQTANKNQELMDDIDSEINDEEKTIANSEKLSLIKTPKKSEECLENDFYMPFSQNVDMFETTPVKVNTESLEQTDIYEMLTQVSNNNGVTNVVEKSVYDIQTQLAVLNESTPNGTNYEKKDILSSQNDSLSNILEPETQPFETKTNETSTSFTSIKIIDETHQDFTLSTSMCEVATQPYKTICEEKLVHSTKKVATDEKVTQEVDNRSIITANDDNDSFSTSLCEVATQPCPQIIEIRNDKVADNEFMTNMDSGSSKKENKSDVDGSFSTSMYEAATQLCPQTYSDVNNDEVVTKLTNENDSFSVSKYEIATQPCPAQTLEKSSIDQKLSSEKMDNMLTTTHVELGKDCSFSDSMFEAATQPCMKSAMEKSQFKEDEILKTYQETTSETHSFSTSMYEVATQPCPQKAFEKKTENDEILNDQIKKGNASVNKTINETNLKFISMYEVATQPSIVSDITPKQNESVGNSTNIKQLNDVGGSKVYEIEKHDNEMTESFFEAATQPAPGCQSNVQNVTKDEESSNFTVSTTKKQDCHLIAIDDQIECYNQSDQIINKISKEIESSPATFELSTVAIQPNINFKEQEEKYIEKDNLSGKATCLDFESNKSVNDSIQNLVSSLSSNFFKAATEPVQCETGSCMKVNDTNLHLNTNIDEQNASSHLAKTIANNIVLAKVCKSNTGPLQKSNDLSFSALPNAVTDSFFEAATQPYKNVETEEKTFLDPLTSLCSDLSVDKINEITNELMYGNISSNLAVTNNHNNNEELHNKMQRDVEISDDNIYEAVSQTPLSSLRNKVMENRINDENKTGKLSTQDLKRILESDDLLHKYDEFQQISVISKNFNKITKKEVILLDNDTSINNDEIQNNKDEETNKKEKGLDKEQSNTSDHIVSKNLVISSEFEKKISTSCKSSFTEVLPMNKKNIKEDMSENENDDSMEKCVRKQSKKLQCKNVNNDDDSSQEINIRSNKKRCTVFPSDTQNFDSENLENEEASQLNIRSSKKRCTVFPPDTQNFESENLENEEASQELNIRSSKKRCNVFPPDTQNFDSENLENEEASQELNIRSSKKRCNVFPPDTQNFDSGNSENEDSSQELNLRSKKKCNIFPPDSENSSCNNLESGSKSVIKTNNNENSSSSDSITTNVVNKLFETDHQSDYKKDKVIISNVCNKFNSSPTKRGPKAVKLKSVEKHATSGKRNNKESKNKSPQEREQTYISRGNITLHSPEVLSELEKQFQLTQVAMSPTQLPIVSDVDDDLDLSEKISKSSSKQHFKRSSQNKKNALLEVFKRNSNCNRVSLKKLESTSLPRAEKIANNIKPTNSTSRALKTEKSFKKFKKVSLMTNNSPTKEKKENMTCNETSNRSLSVSYNSDNSQNSEELGRGKRKRIRTSYEGFILEEDKKRTSRKKISFSQVEDDGNLNDSVTKIEVGISKDHCESYDHHRNNGSITNVKHTISIVSHDLQKKHPKDNELVESDNHKSNMTTNKNIEYSSTNEEETLFLTTNKKSNLLNTSIKNEALSKKNKTEIFTKDKNLSLSEKLDELFNIWGPADRVKLSPRVAKKSYKLLADGKIEGGSTWSTTSNGKKSDACTISNKETKNSKNISNQANNKPSIERKNTTVSNLETGSSNSNVIISRRKRGLIQKNDLCEPISEISKLNTKRKKSNSENSIESDKSDSAIRKSSRILKNNNLEGTSKDSNSQSKPEQISTRSSGRFNKGRTTLKRTVCDPSEDIAKNMTTQSIKTITETLIKAQPLNSIVNGKSNSQKSNSQTNKNSVYKEETSSNLTPEYGCCFSQEFSFHETKIQKERTLPKDKCLPLPLKVRRSNRKKNEKVVGKNLKHIMFTGFTDKKTMSLVNFLGGHIVESPFTCTVLVTDKIRRTTKFLSALSRGLPIVSPQWLIDSKENGRFMDTDNFMLLDKDAEKMFSFNLKNSIEKAQNSKLLDGWSVFVTSSVKPSPEEMKCIIECSGGRFLSKEPTRWPTNSLVISCNEDRAMWSKFSKKGKAPIIVDNEAIFLGVLRQELNLEAHKLL